MERGKKDELFLRHSVDVKHYRFVYLYCGQNIDTCVIYHKLSTRARIFVQRPVV